MRAQALASQHPEIARPFKASGNLQRTTYLTVLAAYAFFVHSLLALERGAIGIALIHAKHSVKLIRCSWVKISMHLKAKITTPAAAESLAEDFTKLNVSISSPALTIPPHEQLPGPSAWALVGPLFRSLLHLSALYSHNGMFQETIYYAEQAHKLVQLVDSGAYQATALTATGSTWLSAGKLDKASELFVRAKELGYSSGESKTAAILNLQLGRLHELLDNREATIAAYSHAHTILETMSSTKYISGIDRISNPAAELEEEISRLSLKPPKTNGPCKRVVSRKTQKRAATISKHTIETPSSISDECILLASLKGVLLRQRAGASMLWKQCEEAIAFLKEADAFSGREVDGINQNICIAKQLLQQSLEQLSADPVYSVLQDSTISFPAVVSSSRTAASTSEKPSGARLSPQAKRQGKSSNSGQQPPKSPSSTNFFDKLRLAQERLSEAHSATIQLSSTATIHTLSSLLCGISILISATGPSLGKFPVHLNTGVCSMGKYKLEFRIIFSLTKIAETSRNIALQRERQTILDEQAYSQTDDEQRWPVLATNDHTKRKNELVPDPIRFQKQYVDIIPKEWTVISISLSSNRQELCLNKMQAGHSPFVLRLPLGRNNSRDVDEEVFDFDQGKAELLEIIELANDNSHGAKELTGRGAKTAWWAERDALNVRLRDLLKNIETVWLGGFRGIFSQHRPRPEILARFQKSFSNILDKHLPSRQNANKKCKNNRVTLDTRILELFIGLEEASAEDCNLDEALTDLLYFVVDILQFHGERNAYDEIDFDSIVIETHDALRSYQEAILAASTSREDKHTILILDKALHIFPWESLPCMDGLAVSRLPSLDCLRERILGLQISSASTGLNRQYIEATNGSYVLNPGGDLKTTQSTFESDLQGLNTWSGIIKREPTEAEMRDNLESKDIFLYFGHGSGAQYIRSKAIKRLRKCAVTMLMGCSSGALTESGEFEPYGPPVDYMLAGCPSLVATLWDVTDKDIDRFAKSTFEHWGLFGAQLARNEYLSKGKKMAGPFPVGREQKSLVKAVAEARKACNFRYLTAAAVCVYGIPVYLK
jgi:separase